MLRRIGIRPRAPRSLNGLVRLAGVLLGLRNQGGLGSDLESRPKISAFTVRRGELPVR
jgi:hypothetical protein